MADGDGSTDVVDLSGNGMGAALNVYPNPAADLLGIPVTNFIESTDAHDGFGFVRALAYLKANAVNQEQGFYQASHKLLIPPGNFYLADTTLDLTHTVVIEGAGSGLASGGKATKLRWDNATGIRVQRYNTTGAIDTTTPGYNGGDSSIIRGIALVGGYSGIEAEFHGVDLRAHALLEDLDISQFEGDGIHSNASLAAPGQTEGGANLCQINRVSTQYNRRGMFIDGADVNAWFISMLNASVNRTYGVEDSSFLGNTYAGCHAAANGWDGGLGSFPTATTFGGNRYYVKVGQAAWCKANAPTGTTADNQGWGYIAAGGAYNGVVPWVINTYDFREGGAYKTDNANAANLFVGCYSEGDQNPSQAVAPTLFVGGLHGAQIKGSAAHLQGHQLSTNLGALRTRAFIALAATGYGNVLAEDRLEFNTAADIMSLEWFSGDLAATVLRSGVSSNWFYALLGEGTANPVGKRKLNFPNGYGLADKKVLSGTTPPVAGAYQRGDMMFNSAPSAGGPPGWMCTTAGSPGTWKAMANLAA